MSFFRWAMRNGAAILFVTALLVFAISLVGQFLFRWSPVGMTDLAGQGETPNRLWFFVSSVAQALSSSAMIFAAACVVDLLGRRFSDKGRPE
jgi:hypothetical protein